MRSARAPDADAARIVELQREGLHARRDADDNDNDEGQERERAESGKQWLLHQLGGPSGVIDAAAVAHALEQRAQMLAAPVAKRAGLPGVPTGWTNLTGFTQSSGRINDLLFLDATGNNMLVGADGGGIWHSTDGGTSWTPVNDFLGSLSIGNFASNDGVTIYAGTNPNGSHTYFPFGIVKSTDGGATWTQIASTNPAGDPGFTFVQRVAVSPADSNVVLAATGGGAYLTTDGGTSWSKVGAISTQADYVAFHPTDANRSAIAYDDGTVRYTTTGDIVGGSLTSTVLASVLGSPSYTKLAYAKSDASRMYALLSDSGAQTGLYESTTSGASWTELTASETELRTGAAVGTFYDQDYPRFTAGVWVDPLNANRVAVFEGWAAFTPDISSGTPAWTRLVSGWTDFHAIVAHPGYDGSTNKTVFFMDDGGLYRIGDIDQLGSQAQFTRLENGLTTTEVYSVSGQGASPIIGAQDVGPRVYRTDSSIGDPTNKWRFMQGNGCPSCLWIGDGMTTAANGANPLVLYGSRQYLDMLRSTDGGATATSIVAGSALNEGQGVKPTGNFNAGFIAPFVLDPSNLSRMLAGGQSLWRANDADTGNPPTWVAIRPPFSDTTCGSFSSTLSTIAIAPSNPDVVWIAHACSGRLFKSVNATQATPTWTEVTTFPVTAAKGAITIDRTNPNIVWVGIAQFNFGNTLYKTTDGGTTWAAVPGLPAAPVYALLQHPGNGSWLYAGTAVGLFASDNGGVTWSTSNEGPANVIVRSLDWSNGTSSPDLLAGTFGRGVFRATVAYTAASNPPRLFNISTRGQILTGFDVMIGGFVISGSTSKTVVIRAIGPSLASFGVTGTIADPTLQLTTSTGLPIAANDNWQAQASPADVTRIQDAGLAPSNTLESALITTLAPGAYTAIVSGNGSTGVGLVEVYELDLPETHMINISTRGRVGTGFSVMIGGFVVTGSGPQNVVVRAIGPSLANFGVSTAMANPTLSVTKVDGTPIASNDDWMTDPNSAQVSANHLAPSDPRESALFLTLQPGAYTAIVSGVGGTTGTGLVEVYTTP